MPTAHLLLLGAAQVLARSLQLGNEGVALAGSLSRVRGHLHLRT
jgi:hypothetical protein